MKCTHFFTHSLERRVLGTRFWPDIMLGMEGRKKKKTNSQLRTSDLFCLLDHDFPVEILDAPLG